MNFSDLVAPGTTYIEGIPNLQACPVIVDFYQQSSRNNPLKHNGEYVAADREVEASHLEELDRVFENEIDKMVPPVAFNCASRGCKIKDTMLNACSCNGFPKSIQVT